MNPDNEIAESENRGDVASDEGGRSGLILALSWAALTLSVAALALVLWALMADDKQPDSGPIEQIQPLEVAVDTLGQDLRAVDSQLDDVVRRQDEHAGAIGEIEGRHERFERRLSRLEADIEDAIARLQRVAGQERSDAQEFETHVNLIAAAALLRFGQEQLELAGDYRAARLAYRQAAGRLEAVDDTRLNRARRLVADELEALSASELPDWDGIAARLRRLVDEAVDWRFQSVASGSDTESDATESDGWWSGVRNRLGSLVRIRERDDPALTGAQIDEAREIVRLRLLAAELAAIRRDAVELARHAGAARAMVEQWFDSEQAAVESAEQILDGMADIVPPVPPELGQALAEVQRLLESS